MTRRVLSCAPNLKATFHHAFDRTRDPLRAIRQLKQCGQIDRILTSGGEGDWAQKVERLASYERAARPEITTLAGGGVGAREMQVISQATAVREFHVGRAARLKASTDGPVAAAQVRELVGALRRACGGN